jgi:hypothetical protein
MGTLKQGRFYDGCRTQDSCSNVMRMRLRCSSRHREEPDRWNRPISHLHGANQTIKEACPLSPNSRMAILFSVQVASVCLLCRCANVEGLLDWYAKADVGVSCAMRLQVAELEGSKTKI